MTTQECPPNLRSFNSMIAKLTRARKNHSCQECQGMIAIGEYYYAITIGGGGLDSLKFPTRVHIGCLKVN